jgi:hypothetical protein
VAKYDRLEEHLRSTTAAIVTLSFADIERILEDTLPSSAFRYATWWENSNNGRHVQARSWLRAGFVAHPNVHSGRVTFLRRA